METVKFVPPGGHRACLSCSAAKAKCVFPEDDAGVSDAPHAVGSISLGDASDTSEHHHHQHHHQFSAAGDGLPPGASSASASASSAHGDGVPAVPKCERCERLGRDCLLPARPRKKRRVGPIKSGASRSSAAGSHSSIASSHHAIPLDSTQTAASAGFMSTFAVNVDRPSSAASTGPPTPSASSAPSSSAAAAMGRLGSEPRPSQHRTALPPSQPSSMSSGLPSGGHGAAPSHVESPRPSPTTSATAGHFPHAQRQPPSHPPPPPPAPPLRPSPASGADTASAQSPPPPRPRSPDPWHAITNAVLNMEEKSAEELLGCYRAYFGKFNPAVDVSDNRITAAMLKADRPLVWLAIVCVTSYFNLERQSRIAKAFIIHLSEQLFQYGRKNIDLLQGIMTFVSGCPLINYIFPQFANLLSVAMALASDLGLDVLEYSRTVDQSPLGPHASRSYHGPARQFPENGHSSEGRRALAGIFCLTQAFSHGGASMTTMKFTPQLLESCRMMEARFAEKQADNDNGKDPAFDFYLSITVRLYHLMSRASQVQLDADVAGCFAIPAKTHIEAFEAELKQLWDGVPTQHQTDLSIKLVYLTTQLYVYKLGIARPVLAPQNEHVESSDPDRDECAVKCLTALNEFFDTFFSIPVDIIPHLSLLHYSALTNGYLMLARMTAFYRGLPQPPNATPGVQLASFNTVLETLATRYEEASTVPHPLGHALRNPLFRSAAARFRSEKLLGISVRRKNQYDLVTTEKQTSAHREANAKPQLGAPLSFQASASSSLLSVDSLVIPTVEEKIAAGQEDEEGQIDNVAQASLQSDLDGSSTAGAGSDDTDPQIELKKIIADFANPQTEQAEWWAWFDDFHHNLTRRESPTGSSSVAGGTSGTSTGSGSSMAGSVAGGFGRRRSRWRQGAPSVASIDSLLNNRDQEPNFDTYIQQQQNAKGPR